MPLLHVDVEEIHAGVCRRGFDGRLGGDLDVVQEFDAFQVQSIHWILVDVHDFVAFYVDVDVVQVQWVLVDVHDFDALCVDVGVVQVRDCDADVQVQDCDLDVVQVWWVHWILVDVHLVDVQDCWSVCEWLGIHTLGHFPLQYSDTMRLRTVHVALCGAAALRAGADRRVRGEDVLQRDHHRVIRMLAVVLAAPRTCDRVPRRTCFPCLSEKTDH